jgi:predicted signal transduction protein with EAL and GGDEF domain
VAAAERIRGCVEPGDVAARLGGDEFAILLAPGSSFDRPGRVGDAVLAALRAPFVLSGQELTIGGSIGVATARPGQAADDLLRDADVAMYQAKLKGKACSVVFDSVMHGSVVERMQLEADLRRAVEHGEGFTLQYQPIVALRTGRLIGVEALARWQHPVRGSLPAAEFVALAEESGAIVPLGEWAIRAACAQLRGWQERSPALAAVPVSVNVSARQFHRPDVVDALRRVVREAGVDPRLVAIEITESAIMDDVEESADKLARLREIGIQIHVDDFGTGYSSLSYLHRFPITAVKIDRSFVAALVGQPESADVVKAIVSIAESLDFDVIAEGVEAEGHVAKLAELRCRYGQGHFLAPPMDASTLEAWAAARARSVA